MNQSGFRRRDLLRGGAMMTAASYARVNGANDRIQVGMIGLGIRGQYVLTLFHKAPSATVADGEIGRAHV